jgi:hypothetical protein
MICISNDHSNWFFYTATAAHDAGKVWRAAKVFGWSL